MCIRDSVPPRSMWNKCFGRRKLTTICCTGCWGLAKTPRGRSAALSGELGGARNVPRNRAGKCRDAAGARTVCAAAGARWEEERLLQAPCVVESGASEHTTSSAPSEHFVTIKGVRAGSSRENLRFSSLMSDQYIQVKVCFESFPGIQLLCSSDITVQPYLNR